jgi:hypothetical protein
MIRSLLVLIVAVLPFVFTNTAEAQVPRPGRPYRGLFGSGGGTSDQQLTLSANLGAGYTTNVPGAIDTSGDTLRQVAAGGAGSTVTTGSASLLYSLSRTKVSFGAGYSTGVSYFPAAPEPLATSNGGNFNMSIRTSRHSQVALGESLSYQPFYSVASFPGIAAQPFGRPVLPDDIGSAHAQNHWTSNSSVSFLYDVNRRTKFSLMYQGYRSTLIFGESDVTSQTASGRMTFNLAKGLDARVGYGYTRGTYGNATSSPDVEGHSIDAGVDFSRALSISRRLTLSFGTGSTVFKYRGETHYYVTGNAHLVRELGRSWNATLSYSRSASIENTYLQPVTSDSISAGLGGLINRRVQFQSSVGASRGEVGFVSSANGFNASYLSAGVTLGLTRALGAGIDYAYYHYLFQRNLDVRFGLSSQTDQQSLRVYLTTSLPLFTRTRSSHVAR